MTDVAELGLRERKRLATRRAIQLAALQQVRDRGLDSVTIDDISRIADISPRTFFNYFSSKEDALVGDGPNFPSDEAVEQFVADRHNLLTGIGELLIDAATETLHDYEIIQLRKKLVSDHPHLTVLRMQTFRAFEQQLVEVVARRIAAESPALAVDPVRLDSRAALITQVAIAAVHHAWKTWARDPLAPETLAERMTQAFAELDEVLGTLSARSLVE